jgi:predicted DNA-binding transcriptional regulator YafY
MLRNKYKPYPTIEDIRAKCEDSLFGSDWGDHISISTIEKDFRAMRLDAELGFFAPIKFSRIHMGYSYSDEEYTIHSIALKSEDIDAIKFASNTLMNFRESPMFAQFRFAIEKIFDRLNISSDVQDERIEKIVQFDSYPNYPGKEFLQDLYTSIKEYHQIEIVYKRFNSDEKSKRLVYPYLLKEYKHRWYLIAYTPAKKGFATYALDRIHALSLLENDFIIDSSFDPSKFFKYAFGITKVDQHFFNVVLKFSLSQKGYLITQPLHSSQKIISEDKNSFTLELQVYLTYELIERILSYGEKVLVVKPEELKKTVYNRLLKASEQY